jgi:hypothetical protein
MPELQIPDSKPLLQSLLSLAWVVEARDPYTGGHLWRVAQFSMILARHIGCIRLDVAKIGLGGFLHDLGKIGVPDRILNKPDKLTDEEYAVIRTHPRIGADLLASHPLNDLIRNAVFMHHETPDGKGYPSGLKSADIPLDARIVGLTDAFDAMTSTRPYRKGMPVAKALEIIGANLGTQFDKELGEAFIAIAKEGAMDAIVGHSEPQIPLQVCGMCGPTILVTRAHKEGDILFCRCCGGGAKLHRDGKSLSISPVDQKAKADDLAGTIDDGLIQELSDLYFLDALGNGKSLGGETLISRFVDMFARR